jgi:ATP-binding cassette subfamily B protein
MSGPLGPLDALAWPSGRLGEALQALARRSGLAGTIKEADRARDLGEPPPGADGQALEDWIEAAAAASGLEAEPVEVSYRETADLVRRAGPALLRLPGEGAPRFVALLAGGRRTVLLLDPGHGARRVPAAALVDTLRCEHDARLGPEVDRLLDEAGVPRRRRARARAAILAERLSAARIGGGWLFDLPPGGSFRRALRRAHLPGRVAVMVVSHMMQHALLLLSWWILGLGVLEGRLDHGWLLAWALLLFTFIPFRALELWCSAVITARAGALFKQRLLAGALRIEPEEIRHQGSGQLLGRILSSDALEVLVLSGGHVGLITLSEIVLAVPVLAAGAAGWWHVLLLLAWLAFTLLLSARYVRQRRAWTAARLEMTHDLVEQMVGYRTRLAQQSPARWHDGEDRQLERYVELSEGLDRWSTRLRVFLPRGWLLVSLLALTGPFISGQASPGSLAVALGGTLFSYWTFWKMVRGLADLAEAAVSWRQAAPIFHAAARREDGVPEAALTVQAVPRSGEEAAVVVEAHDLVFRYGERAEPALAGCTFTVRSGERLLLEGPSGGGKSTLASVIAGLRIPQSGLLLLQGLDRYSLGTEGWRRRTVAAPQFQENHVLIDTLAFNLLMGREWPPRPGDMEEAEEVCRELGLGDLLDRMPAGLLQMVGESGWQLSHGEKSRLYIARALLQSAELVILDESFAALDPESLRRALDCVLRRARTLMVIAHP